MVQQNVAGSRRVAGRKLRAVWQTTTSKFWSSPALPMSRSDIFSSKGNERERGRERLVCLMTAAKGVEKPRLTIDIITARTADLLYRPQEENLGPDEKSEDAPWLL